MLGREFNIPDRKQTCQAWKLIFRAGNETFQPRKLPLVSLIIKLLNAISRLISNVEVNYLCGTL
jgi:hypothetical protein